MMISILSSILVWGAIALILLRLVNDSGITILSKNKAMSFLLADKRRGLSDAVNIKTVLLVCAGALVFRIAVFAISATGVAMFENSDITFPSFLKHYVQWDANNYQRIADGGYGGHIAENGDFLTLVFFPLYPWIAKAMNLIFRDTYVSLLVTSFLCYSVGCGFLYKLCARDFGKDTAMKAVVLISVFPHSLFFGTMMNESMLFMNSVITLYFIREHKWHLAGLFGALASLSRMVGILLVVPAAVEWLEHYKILGKLKNKNIKEVWKLFYSKGLWIAVMLLGTGIYLLCNYKFTGEWLKFLEYQERYWSNGACYFGSGIAKIAENAFSAGTFIRAAIWIPEIVSIAFVIAALLYGIRRSRNMYTAFLAIYIIINTGFEWPISIARYMVCAIPAFIFLADFTDRHKWTYSFITALMAVGMGIYLTAYLFAKQIL